MDEKQEAADADTLHRALSRAGKHFLDKHFTNVWRYLTIVSELCPKFTFQQIKQRRTPDRCDDCQADDATECLRLNIPIGDRDRGIDLLLCDACVKIVCNSFPKHVLGVLVDQDAVKGE